MWNVHIHMVRALFQETYVPCLVSLTCTGNNLILGLFGFQLIFSGPCRICDGVQFGAGIRFLWNHISWIWSFLVFQHSFYARNILLEGEIACTELLLRLSSSIKVFALTFHFLAVTGQIQYSQSDLYNKQYVMWRWRNVSTDCLPWTWVCHKMHILSYQCYTFK